MLAQRPNEIRRASPNRRAPSAISSLLVYENEHRRKTLSFVDGIEPSALKRVEAGKKGGRVVSEETERAGLKRERRTSSGDACSGTLLENGEEDAVRSQLSDAGVGSDAELDKDEHSARDQEGSGNHQLEEGEDECKREDVPGGGQHPLADL